jgi:peptidoglycan/LPS O-acetylase OafA/YrhL
MAQSAVVRYRELDALRGIGAISVMIGHFMVAFHTESEIWHKPILEMIPYCLGLAVYGGHSAVLFFFVLSGFVLSLPAVNQTPQTYIVFITRRFFRLYVPYLFALALSIMGNLRWHGPLELTPWADHTWSQTVHARAVVEHVLLIGQFDSAQFNTALWTLNILLRLSLFFPALCWFVLRVSPWASFVTALGLEAVSTYFQTHKGLNSYILTLHATAYVIIGILLARYKDQLFSWAANLPRLLATGYLAAGLVMFWWGSLVFQLLVKLALHHNPRFVGFDLVIGFGAAMIMTFSVSFEPLSTLLNRNIPQFFGRISYSIYLIHSTVLFALLHEFGKAMPTPILFCIYVSTVVAVSMLFNFAVETPFTTFGRSITRRSSADITLPNATEAAVEVGSDQLTQRLLAHEIDAAS